MCYKAQWSARSESPYTVIVTVTLPLLAATLVYAGTVICPGVVSERAGHGAGRGPRRAAPCTLWPSCIGWTGAQMHGAMYRTTRMNQRGGSRATPQQWH